MIPFCRIDSCHREATARKKTLCQRHYMRIWRWGDPNFIHPEADRYKATGSVNNYGYRRIYKNGKRLLEHRVIMEQFLKRPLKRYEVIHHKNGDKLDNRLENLELIKNHSLHIHYHHSQSKKSLADWAKISLPKPYVHRPRGLCFLSDCNAPEKYRGLCRRHYWSFNRWERKT